VSVGPGSAASSRVGCADRARERALRGGVRSNSVHFEPRGLSRPALLKPVVNLQQRVTAARMRRGVEQLEPGRREPLEVRGLEPVQVHVERVAEEPLDLEVLREVAHAEIEHQAAAKRMASHRVHRDLIDAIIRREEALGA